jgi:hypothetical protein
MKARVATTLSSPAHMSCADAVRFSPRPHWGRGGGGEGDPNAAAFDFGFIASGFRPSFLRTRSRAPRDTPSPCIPLPPEGGEGESGVPLPIFRQTKRTIRLWLGEHALARFAMLSPSPTWGGRSISSAAKKCSRWGDSSEPAPHPAHFARRPPHVGGGEEKNAQHPKTIWCGLRAGRHKMWIGRQEMPLMGEGRQKSAKQPKGDSALESGT